MRQVNILVWALIFASSESSYIWRLLKDAGQYTADSDIKSCLLFWALKYNIKRKSKLNLHNDKTSCKVKVQGIV